MNKTIIRGRLFVLIAIVFGIALCNSVIAQKKTTKTKIAKKKTSTQNSILRDKNFVVTSLSCRDSIELVRPPFPPAAKAAGVSGTVSVVLIIDKKGNVEKIEPASGHLLLQPAAIMLPDNPDLE